MTDILPETVPSGEEGTLDQWERAVRWGRTDISGTKMPIKFYTESRIEEVVFGPGQATSLSVYAVRMSCFGFSKYMAETVANCLSNFAAKEAESFREYGVEFKKFPRTYNPFPESPYVCNVEYVFFVDQKSIDEYHMGRENDVDLEYICKKYSDKKNEAEKFMKRLNQGLFLNFDIENLDAGKKIIGKEVIPLIFRVDKEEECFVNVCYFNGDSKVREDYQKINDFMNEVGICDRVIEEVSDLSSSHEYITIEQPVARIVVGKLIDKFREKLDVEVQVWAEDLSDYEGYEGSYQICVQKASGEDVSIDDLREKLEDLNLGLYIEVGQNQL